MEFILALRTVHDIIEREFFEIETFKDNEDFFNNIFSYQLFFNLVRPNTYKENKSPWQLAQEKIPDIRKEVLMIPPVDLRCLLRKKMDFQSSGVYDVSSGPFFCILHFPYWNGLHMVVLRPILLSSVPSYFPSQVKLQTTRQRNNYNVHPTMHNLFYQIGEWRICF